MKYHDEHGISIRQLTCILHGKKYIYDLQTNEERVCINRFKTNLKNRLEVKMYVMESSHLHLDVRKILLVELDDNRLVTLA